jgi:hypothetical protein
VKLDKKIPQPVLLKLLEMDDRAAALAQAADAADTALARARDLINGRTEDPRVNIDQLRREFDGIHAAAQHMRRCANAEHSALSKIKSWLDQLPPTALLETVVPKVNGHDLPSVRSRLSGIEAEISALQSVPVPPLALKDRIAEYVSELTYDGRPLLRGADCMGISWPLHEQANRRNGTDFDKQSCNPLLMATWLFPQQLATRLCETIERECNSLYPLLGRAEKITELQAEADLLQRIEAALLDAAVSNDPSETHDPRLPPAATLGVPLKMNGGGA